MDINNLFHDSIFVKHDFSVLRNIGAQEYLSDVIIENLENQGVHVLGRKHWGNFDGTPFAEITFAEASFDSPKGVNYCESLFWRIDMRAGKYCIRLIQYGEPDEKRVKFKKDRMMVLRHEAKQIADSQNCRYYDKVTNNGIYRGEVIVFFWEDKDFNALMKAIPVISQYMVNVFNNLK